MRWTRRPITSSSTDRTTWADVEEIPEGRRLGHIDQYVYTVTCFKFVSPAQGYSNYYHWDYGNTSCSYYPTLWILSQGSLHSYRMSHWKIPTLDVGIFAMLCTNLRPSLDVWAFDLTLLTPTHFWSINHNMPIKALSSSIVTFLVTVLPLSTFSCFSRDHLSRLVAIRLDIVTFRFWWTKSSRFAVSSYRLSSLGWSEPP